MALEGRRGKGRCRSDFLAVIVEQSRRIPNFHKWDNIDREKGLKSQHFPDDSLEHFRDVHKEEDGGGDNRYPLLPMVYLHLNAVLDAQGQQRNRQNIADQRQSIPGIALRQFIRGQLHIFPLCALQDLLLEAADIEQLRALDALLQRSHIIVLVIIVVADYFPLYLAVDVEDGVVDGREDHEDSDEFGSVGRDELDGGDEDDHVFVDAEQTVTRHEDLLVVLGRTTATWLYLSANLTLSSWAYHASPFFPN